MNPYWLLRAFGKTPNISHATTTGLESAGEKQLNPTVPELIENLPGIQKRKQFQFVEDCRANLQMRISGFLVSH
jgi:hypothetical protein